MVLSESKIEVRYAETDQMGVVHHAVYPVWYEVARTDYMKKTGMTYAEMEKMGVMTPVVDLGCHYVGSAYYDETITVRVRILELSAAKIKFGYELYKDGGEKPFHTGYTLHGWADTKTVRPINLKKKYPEIYASIQALME